MAIQNISWLTAVIAAHPNHEVFGRTRLQKTVWLLQRLGMPTDYGFSLHFYGPYSEEIKADIGLADRLGLVKETPRTAQDGTEYFVVTAEPSQALPDLGSLKEPLTMLVSEDSTVLELAATYDAFRVMGLPRDAAVQSLRAKKGDKCAGGREARALEIVRALGLEDVAA